MNTETLNEKQEILTTGFLLLNRPPHRLLFEIKDLLTMGRDSANQVHPEDPFVSHRHARIERRDSGFVIRDLRSRNGTFVNGAQVLEAQLHDGDRVQIGQTELHFSSSRESKIHAGLPTSRNPIWQKELAMLPQIAESELPVLLQGPSGAGKEVLASALHRFSPRSGKPLISVNCSALSESLIESELFGHVRGSFTGALQDRSGAFVAAHQGTLFLDEIGDLPLPLQPKLLRALENAEVRPLGSDKNVKVNVRVISATHQNLRGLVQQGRFREDLFFRLNVLRLNLPALQSRPEDFEDLIYHFAKQHRVRFSFAAIQKLKEHTWPGNIRELRNVVARAKAYFPHMTIETEHLSQIFEPPISAMPQVPNGTGGKISAIKELELKMILDRLLAHQGNQRQAALDLGIPKSTLHDRIRTYGIDIKQLLADRGISS
ncbi:MAG: sigma 54-interacting transcriptional regulator [Bdellovibrionales bacterium]